MRNQEGREWRTILDACESPLNEAAIGILKLRVTTGLRKNVEVYRRHVCETSASKRRDAPRIHMSETRGERGKKKKRMKKKNRGGVGGNC